MIPKNWYQGNHYLTIKFFKKIFRWDSVIVKEDYKATKLIEHPEQQAPPAEAPAPEAVGLYLTTKERKKMRRLNRKEVQKEEQEKIRLGLLPPPEPKVRIRNTLTIIETIFLS